jgi:hypothetical protein
MGIIEKRISYKTMQNKGSVIILITDTIGKRVTLINKHGTT